MDQAGSIQRVYLIVGQAEAVARPADARSATAAECPSVKGDFRSTNRPIARSASSHSDCVSAIVNDGLGIDHRVPRARVVDPAEDLRGVETKRVDE